jgi:hypothetical protein
MPIDQYTPYYGETCMKCGHEERQYNKTWCPTCISAPRRAREAYLQAVAREEQAWVPVSHRSPPPAPAKEVTCSRCGGATWTLWEDGRRACARCGTEPS